MPFGLKNAGATYQRAMTKIFDDLIHMIVECYVDDLVIKAMSYEEHLRYLEVVFSCLREHALKLNPLKCAFMVSSSKFLVFVVRHRGNEIDPGKIKAIMELPPPKNLKQLRSLQGQLAYIRRFIANLSGKIQPFTRLTMKGISFKWDKKCQQTFEEIKAYLLNPSVLATPIPGNELILYITALDKFLGALLAQENQDDNQNAMYYLSRMMVGAEHGYSPIEKHYLVLIFAVKKLRHYMLAHKVIMISKVDPLKYLMTRPMLTGRLAKWAIILTEFDITYMPQKAIKGQVLADFLAAHPIQDNSPLKCDFLDEETLHIEEENPIWELYFDGASSIRPIAGPRIPTVRAISQGCVMDV
jgi:RNase H-like domain found in reverse transcriptase/Reverse transcriptase (RNA-dependent DNA polymerase)